MPVLEIVGWSLLHSVWQGAVVAVLLWGVLRVFRQRLPGVRYVASGAALVVLLALPVVNGYETVRLWEGNRVWLVDTGSQVIQGELSAGRWADPAAVTAEVRRRHARVWPAATGPMAALATKGRGPARGLAAVWLVVGLALVARLLVSAGRAARLADSGSFDARWAGLGRRVAGRMAVSRPVRVRVTSRVEVPVLVGWRWPVVLVPPSATGLPDDEVEAILAHEMAHVRRHDYLVNLLQTLAETLLFYSPAAWWVSSRMREERECSCDEAAIRAIDGGSPRCYLRALLTLETARPAGVGALAVNGGPLLRRIRRIHARRRDQRAIDWRAAAVVALLVVSLVAAAPGDRAPLSAQVSATSLVLRDLDGMRVVVRTVTLPGPAVPEPSEVCPESGSGREA